MHVHEEALAVLEELARMGRRHVVGTAALEAAGARWRAAAAVGDVDGQDAADALTAAVLEGAEVGELGLTGEELVGILERVDRRLSALLLAA